MLILLKLSSGDEILGHIKEDNPTSYVLQNPLKVMYQLRGASRGPVVYLHQLMPFADDNNITFPKSHVVFTANPKKGLNNYYNSVLSDLSDAQSLIDEQLNEMSIDESEVESDKEMVLALLEREHMSNNSIH